MIVRDIMTTRLVTLAPDDTLARAANLLRQYQFHHLPVARQVQIAGEKHEEYEQPKTHLILEGLLTSADIDIAVALANQDPSHPWQERHVAEVMHRAVVRVTPVTTVAAAAQILVERGINYLPVVEFGLLEDANQPLLVGLVTRSDLLIALARAMGAYEPGMQIDITLPMGNMAPLAKTLLLAAELHMPVRSVIAAPTVGGMPQAAMVRLGTINPAPLLMHLHEEGIHYSFGDVAPGGDAHGQ